MKKEDYAIVLEYLPNGYPLEGKMRPVVQAIGKNNLALLELVPRRGVSLESGEEVYIGPEKRDKIYFISGRLRREKLTEHSKEELSKFIESVVKTRQEEFIKFFNEAEAINKRVHQIELLPGMGKKHMQEIIKEREEAKFESFEDMKKRVSNLPDPEKAVEKRIIQEITQMERYNLFVGG